MNGMNAITGKAMSGIEHLRQSVNDILATPLGSRVMRRDYGSRLPFLVDAPMNRATLLQIYMATAEALHRWEPRIRVRRVSASAADEGRVELNIAGEYLPDGKRISLEGIVVK